MKQAFLIALGSALILCSCSSVPESKNSAAVSSETVSSRRGLDDAMKAVAPFFRPMKEPGELDWLATYNESGETFEQYMAANPSRPTAERRTIFVLPLGDFTPGQLEIIAITTEYLAAFYGLPVKALPAAPLPGNLDATDYRTVARTRQVRTGYILEEILMPRLPADAAALIAFTSEDLYPDESMNYVFGQASLEKRVGVWSLKRLDDNAGRETFLKRTMKIAVHETGHMFSFKHCTKYECVMSGTNHLGETDQRPIDACPECMAKIVWVTETRPEERYDRLAAFAGRFGMPAEKEDFTRKAAAVRSALQAAAR